MPFESRVPDTVCSPGPVEPAVPWLPAFDDKQDAYPTCKPEA
jgi:hypothetical protein